MKFLKINLIVLLFGFFSTFNIFAFDVYSPHTLNGQSDANNYCPNVCGGSVTITKQGYKVKDTNVSTEWNGNWCGGADQTTGFVNTPYSFCGCKLKKK